MTLNISISSEILHPPCYIFETFPLYASNVSSDVVSSNVSKIKTICISITKNTFLNAIKYFFQTF